MGQTHSEAYQDFIHIKIPSHWQVISLQQDHELWQNRLTKKKYMAYMINVQESTSDHNMQMYHFRKLNQLYLIAPDMILKNKDDLCTESNGVYLLIENIPVRLHEVNSYLNFEERLSILAVTFSALHTLNFVYGPLFINENSIGFNEQGKIKVWINDHYSSNQPSNEARNDLNYKSGTATDNLMLDCVTQVLRIVGNKQVQTYPLDFRQEVSNIQTFAEGQQFIYNYSQSRGIQLSQNIYFWTAQFKNRNEDFQQNVFKESKSRQIEHSILYKGIPESNQSSFISHQTYRPAQDASCHSKVPNRVLTISNATGYGPPRSSRASQKITINYINKAKATEYTQIGNSILSNRPISSYHPPLQKKIERRNVIHKRQIQNTIEGQVNRIQFKPQKVLQDQRNDISQKEDIQKQKNQQIEKEKEDEFYNVITSELDNNRQKQEVQESKNVSSDHINMQSSNLQDENLILTNRNSSLDHTINIEDQIKNWEAKILLNLSRNQKLEEQIANQQQEHQTDNLEKEIYVKGEPQQLAESETQEYPYSSPYPDDIEKYIRDKYSRYIQEVQGKNFTSRNHNQEAYENIYEPQSTSSYQNSYEYKYKTTKQTRQQQKLTSIKQLFLDFRKDSVSDQMFPSFRTIRQQPKQSQLTSYNTIKITTFGKIQTNPSVPYQQYNKTNDKFVDKKVKPKHNLEDSKLEERYNKYVTNRQSRTDYRSKNTTVSHQADYRNRQKDRLQNYGRNREQQQSKRSYKSTIKRQQNKSRQWHKKMMLK